MWTLPHDFSVTSASLPGCFPNRRVAPGWPYIFEHNSLFKIGKTTNPKRRLREAQTWIPFATLIGVKPFWDIHRFELTLLCGLAVNWTEGEWHGFESEEHSEFLVEGFRIFDDHDRDENTYEFGYWIRGSGMAEVIAEFNSRRGSLRKFQRDPY
jgi:hypothetical protein